MAVRPTDANDRIACFVPQASVEAVAPNSIDDANHGRMPYDGLVIEVDQAWQAYMRVWAAHDQAPQSQPIRNYLGLPPEKNVEITSQRGRSAPRWLGWRAGSYQQFETPHFILYSRASEEYSHVVAAEAEAFYWVWTQVFFPFWIHTPSAGEELKKLAKDQNVDAGLATLTPLPSPRSKMRLVLFKNDAEYQQTLGRDEPNIGISTGFYSDTRLTTFLYEQAAHDSATRYHEWTHQMFREASTSRLGPQSPGTLGDFWIVEGLAGYMESLQIDRGRATVGGWDSERIQYARYRVLGGGDSVALDELRGEGRLVVQKRSDLARWYAHAIAQTHRMIDGDDGRTRQWIYNETAKLYRMNGDLPPAEEPGEEHQRLAEFLAVDDEAIEQNRPLKAPRKLCLVGCQITSQGLAKIPTSPQLHWLDLTRLPITTSDVERLCDDPSSLETLSLEGTAIDSTIVPWLTRATNLEELDLSSTAIDDTLGDALIQMEGLKTLWLTGSQVSDRIVDRLNLNEQLEQLDLQRTHVTDDRLRGLRSERPRLIINPLEIR